MKTIFRNLGLGVLIAGGIAASATNSFAQDVCTTDIEGNQALYKQFTDNFDKKEVEKIETAITAGKQYVEKYAACADYKAQVDYIKGQIAPLEASVVKLKGAKEKNDLLLPFDAAAKSKNVAEVFAKGKQIMSKEAVFGDVALDVAIAMAVAGFEQTIAATPVDTYNADTITYAKNAIQKIESGKTSKSLGVWSYNLKPADKAKYADEKSYALGVLNYIVGNVGYYRDGKNNPDKKKEALAYFYKSSQYNSLSKADPTIYQAIGAWYLDEAIKIENARKEILKTTEKGQDNEQTLAMIAEQKGYADRAIDAYARAHKVAKDDPKQKKEYVDGLYKTLKDVYAFRYDNKVEGMDTFVAGVASKPMPDPATAITPVVEAAPATTTTPTNSSSSTTTTTPATTPATTAPAATAKPAAATTTTTTTTTAKPATEVKTTATTPAKPAVPKKKGTR